jgi:AraC family transcriptional regulator
MDYSILLKELPAQLALRVESRTTMDDIGAAVGKAFAAIMAVAHDEGASFAGPPFVIYPEDCSGEFAFALHMPVGIGCGRPAADSGVTLEEVPGGPAACVLHTGPYERLGDAYEVLATWLRANARRPSGRPREIYLNDPGQVEPEGLLTEIAWPLA